MRSIRYLETEDLLVLIQDLRVGPVRDLGLLDSAAHRPQTALFGEDAYPRLNEKAAVLLESLVRNHPLGDGNKRLGWLATVVFMGLNGIDLDGPDDEVYDLVMSVAAGHLAYQQSAEVLAEWSGQSEVSGGSSRT